MHPEVSATWSRLVMEDRLREGHERRRAAHARTDRAGPVRVRVGSALVRIGTRLAAPRHVPTIHRA